MGLDAEFPIVKVYLAPGARLPGKATSDSAGFDVHACLEIDTYIQIPPGERITIPTGLYFQIPSGFFITLRPRSGLALKNGLTLLNSPATIDSDYRGELRVLIVNLGTDNASIQNGDRIAQLFVEKCLDFKWEQVQEYDHLEKSVRGTGGFGSTGMGLA